MCLQSAGKPSAFRSNNSLDFSFRCHVFSRLDLFSFHLISSPRSFSWKLFTASHCHRSLRHPIPSHLISCRVFSGLSPQFISSHLMSSLLFSALLSWSGLFSSLLTSFDFFSSLVSSSEFSFFQFLSVSPFYAVCLNSALLSSSHVRSSQLIPSHVISVFPAHLALLTSSQLFSALLSSPHVFSFLLSSLRIV
jgi:hypothetical protein